jgi:hypothetical protein
MPARRLTTSFTVRRPITLAGTAYAVGAVVAAKVVLSALGRQLDAYVSRGFLSPTPNQYPLVYSRLGTTYTAVRHGATYHASPTEVQSIAAEA